MGNLSLQNPGTLEGALKQSRQLLDESLTEIVIETSGLRWMLCEEVIEV